MELRLDTIRSCWTVVGIRSVSIAMSDVLFWDSLFKADTFSIRLFLSLYLSSLTCRAVLAFFIASYVGKTKAKNTMVAIATRHAAIKFFFIVMGSVWWL